MSQTSALITTLKTQLRAQRITYRDLADHLDLSESAIKQMFASGNMTLSRLEDIARVLGMEMGELFAHIDPNAGRVKELPLAVERELVGDAKLLLVGYCALNYWSYDEILERYAISATECIGYLARLDRMKVIELLPGNRIKPLIANNFRWIPNGPIERFVRSRVQGRFLDADFGGELQLRAFKSGMLTIEGRRQLVDRLAAVARAFDEQAVGSRARPVDEKAGVTMLLAFREWGFEAFDSLERKAEG